MAKQEGAGGSKEPEKRALPADVSNQLGLVDFGNNEKVKALRAAGIEAINSEIERIEALNDLFDEMYGPEKRLAEVAQLMGKNFVGPEAYKVFNPSCNLGVIPKLPDNIISILNEACPFAKNGKLVKDTHRLVLVPKTIDSEELTLLKLRELAIAAGTAVTPNRDPSFYAQDWYDNEAFAKQALGESRWVLVCEKEVPEFFRKNDSEQIEILKSFPNYRTAEVMERVGSMVMNDFQNDERLYPNTWARCENRASAGERVDISNFNADGLRVFDCGGAYHDERFGRALVRKLI